MKAMAILAMIIVSASVVTAEWSFPDNPNDIKEIEEPEFPEMDQVVYIDELTGNFVDIGYATGGWKWDDGWHLEDGEHTTGEDITAACTTGTETYLSNYMDSGTEASGTAWKYAKMSILNQEGGDNNIDNVLTAWTVNEVPPGGDHTSLFYEEFTGKLDTGLITHSLVVEGKAKGDAENPTVIQTHYESSDNLFQQKAVGINIDE